MPDDLEASAYRTNHVRRGIGVLVAGAPVVLLLTSLARAVTSGHQSSTTALVVMLLATGIAALNFFLSFIRGLRRNRDKRNVSGVPIIGTLLVVVATVLGFGSALCAAVGLLAMALDTGGSVWFLIATWSDVSFWDDPNDSM